MDYAIVIPARFESTRLPGKPLIDLCGVPIVVRTYRQCAKACPADRIHVATDDERVAAVCRSNGIQVIETPGDCLTGTDRVAACLESLDVDVLVNVQGDEPVFEPDDLLALLDAARENRDQVLCGYCRITEEEQFWDRAVPKVVLRPDGRLLYMTRGAVPIGKSGRFVDAWRQVCAYVLPGPALESFVSASGKTPLEEIEDIEILRFLELGWEVRMVELSDRSFSVDVPADLEIAERLIRDRGL
jgi:3-deoxy-manno-octulosonate cytidylyltransferase (CMP-KDO synthetase)